MGGAGTWYLAAQQPHRFAAIAPICGASLWWQGFPEKAVLLKNIPIWTFHGEADAVVPISITEAIVEVLEANQAEVRFTRYPGVEHNSWTQTYTNPELYKWLYQKKLDR
jgi:predicted peptidase